MKNRETKIKLLERENHVLRDGLKRVKRVLDDKEKYNLEALSARDCVQCIRLAL